MTVDDFLNPASGADALQPPVLTVAELNRMARRLLESNLPLLWVRGELCNFTQASSGHWYFSLKDDWAQLRCTFFRHKNQFVDWAPENGQQVEVRGLPTLYEPRGDFQLNVELMRRGGLGALYEAFEKLKAKLAAEGLFDSSLKKTLPVFPKTLGIVTSPQAAALRDVLTTLHRRMPGLPVILYPTPVQGRSAATQIAQALLLASARRECDVLILCRGGGSIEDLWCFNDEAVARAVAACIVPVVTGIGHETDFTLADFVADLRAPTPTAAAEIASPNQAELLHKVVQIAARIKRLVRHQQQNHAQRLDGLARRLKHPGENLAAQQLNLVQLARRMINHFQTVLERRRWQQHQFGSQLTHLLPAIPIAMKNLQWQATVLHARFGHTLRERGLHLTRLHGHLQHLNPQAVLERGYSITQNAQGRIIRTSTDLTPGEALHLSFARGAADVRVESAD
jgi:exodeoxyribonuclease VII large subunit